jgi:hypothetical protein
VREGTGQLTRDDGGRVHDEGLGRSGGSVGELEQAVVARHERVESRGRANGRLRAGVAVGRKQRQGVIRQARRVSGVERA